jgi:hypothetical protein
MNTYQEILIQHCKKILGDRRIRNKIVVLCEGQGVGDNSWRGR